MDEQFVGNVIGKGVYQVNGKRWTVPATIQETDYVCTRLGTGLVWQMNVKSCHISVTSPPNTQTVSGRDHLFGCRSPRAVPRSFQARDLFVLCLSSWTPS